MARFNEAFIFLTEGGDPAARGVREGRLARTAFVPVPDAATAATVAAELQHAGGLDLIELYGGFGATTAAAVIDATGGQVPVGLVGVEEKRPPRNAAVIFESEGADPATDRYVYEQAGTRMTIVPVPDVAAVRAAAVTLADEGVDSIYLCGGTGVVPAAAVLQAVGDRVSVGAAMYAFESLPGVAGYRARFEQAMGL